MATVKISNLPPAPPGTGTGSSQGTDLFPATDTTDTTSAASGTTKKYTLSEIYNWMLQAQGLTVYEAVRAATTLALTVTYANGIAGVGATLTNAGAQIALSVDGVTMAVGNRVLVWQQTGPTQNGIYVVTDIGSGSSNWVMTRATDYDQPSEIVQYGIMLVNQGDTYAGRLFQETGAGPFTIGSTPITFALYTAGTLQVPVLLSQGGTSASLVADNGGIFYSTASAGAILAGTVTAGRVLQSGAGGAPSWSTPTYPSASGTSGKVLASDGTNIVYSTSTFPVVGGTAGNILISDGTNYIASTSLWPNTVGSSGTILRSNGTSNAYTTATYPSSTTINQILYSSANNTIAGITTANSGALVTNGSGVPSWQAMSAGQVLIGTTAGAPVAAAINSGTGIVVANGSGTITVSATGGGFATVSIAGTSQAGAVSTKYIALNAGQTTLTLPSTYAVGDVIALIGSTANVGGWIVQAAGGDTIRVNNATTSAGGTVTCTAVAGQCIELVCDVANSSWIMDSTVSVLLTTA